MTQIGAGGMALLETWEQGPGGGPALSPYLDRAKRWTWGFGHLMHPGESRGPFTRAQCVDQLHADSAAASAYVDHAITVPLTQNQFDALACFTFNEGGGALMTSTLREALNQGNYDEVPAQLRRWDKIHDPDTGQMVEVAGLKNRREAEIALWLTP